MTHDNDMSIPDSPEGIESLEASAGQEAPASWRQTAIQCRQFYISLTAAGFPEPEALELVKVVIRTAAEEGLRGGA